MLDGLLSATFTALSARESVGYYECVLRAARPETVPRQAKREVYTALLKQLEQGLPVDAREDGEVGEDLQGPQALDQQDAADDDFKIHAPSTVRGAVAKRPRAKRIGPLGLPARPQASPVAAMWGGDAPAPHVPLDGWSAAGTVSLEQQPELGPPVAGYGDGDQVSARSAKEPLRHRAEQQSPAAGSAASSSALPPGPQPLPSVEPSVGARDDGSAKGKKRKREPVVCLDGHLVYAEVWNFATASDHYSRYEVHCPIAHHQEGRKRCVKKRNTGHRQTARFGDMEPLAYLGAWLRLGCAGDSRQAHMDRIPTDAQIDAYAAEMGWLPTEFRSGS